MSKRITMEEGREKYKNYIESQELNKKGIKPKISRREKKRRMRLSKTERFVEMLKRRGGFFEQKEGKKKQDVN
jgi:hypothetical protein